MTVQMARLSSAVFGADAVEDDDERAGRPADAHARAAERRDDETRR